MRKTKPVSAYTYVHFLEIPKSSINYNIILIRPKYGSHVHLEKKRNARVIPRFEKRCKLRTALLALTLLFSLCITPIIRTLIG